MHPARPVFDRLLAAVPSAGPLHRWLASMRTQVYDRVEDVIDDLAGYNDEADYEDDVRARAQAARLAELDARPPLAPSGARYVRVEGNAHGAWVDPTTGDRWYAKTEQARADIADLTAKMNAEYAVQARRHRDEQDHSKAHALQQAINRAEMFLVRTAEATPAAPFAKLDAIKDRIEAAVERAKQGVIDPGLRDRLHAKLLSPPLRTPEDVDPEVARAIVAWLDVPDDEDDDDALRDARAAAERVYGPDADVVGDARAVGVYRIGSWPIELQNAYDHEVGKAYIGYLYADWQRRIRARAAQAPPTKQPAAAAADLVVAHDPEEGTTIRTRDRAWNAAIKAMRYPRFVWSGSRTAWYVQQSADKAVPPYDLERIAAELRKAGATVEVKRVQGDVRSFAERLEDKRDRADARADRYATYSEKAAGRAEGAFKRAEQIGERFYGGQPILVGHHSEGRARSDQAKAHRAMSKSVAEAAKAEHWEQRAEAVERHAARMEAPDVINRRLVTLSARLRDVERKLQGHVSWTDDGKPFLKKPEGGYLEALQAEQRDVTEQITHWQEQLGAKGLRSWGPNDFRVGQIIGQGVVRAVGDKSVTVVVGAHNENQYGNRAQGDNYWTRSITYTKLKPTSQPDPGPGDPPEAKPAAPHPRAKLIEAVYAAHPDKDARFRIGYKHVLAMLDPELNRVDAYVLEDVPDGVLLDLAKRFGLGETARKAGPHPDAKLIAKLYTAAGEHHRRKGPEGTTIQVWHTQAAALRAAGVDLPVEKRGWDNSWSVLLESLTDAQRAVLARSYKLDPDAIRGGTGPKDKIGRLLAFAAEDPGHFDKKTIEGEQISGTWVKAFAQVWGKTDAESREKLAALPMKQLVSVITRHLMGS